MEELNWEKAWVPLPQQALQLTHCCVLLASWKLSSLVSSDEFRNKAMISFQKKVEVITIQDFILQSWILFTSLTLN